MCSWMPKFGTAMIEMQRRAHAHRRQVGRAVAAGAHLVELGERGDLAQMRDAAGVDHRGADVVDQLVLDQLLAVPDRVEHLADRDRRHGMLADQPERFLVLGRRRVLDPEHAQRLERLAEPRRLDRREAVVHVVQQVEVEAEFLAQRFEKLRRVIEVFLRRPHGLDRQALLGRLVAARRPSARRRPCRGPARPPARGSPCSPAPCARRPNRPPRRCRRRWRGNRPSRRRGSCRRAAGRAAGRRPWP